MTNLNVYSTALTAGEMQQHTIGGSCIPEGDYLAWNKMQWNLKGQAVIETLDEKEPCMGHTAINIYPAQYSSMKSCGHFCGNLGSRTRLTLVSLRTSIKFDKEEMIWTLTDAESNVTGMSTAPHKSFTLGRQTGQSVRTRTVAAGAGSTQQS